MPIRKRGREFFDRAFSKPKQKAASVKTHGSLHHHTNDAESVISNIKRRNKNKKYQQKINTNVGRLFDNHSFIQLRRGRLLYGRQISVINSNTFSTEDYQQLSKKVVFSDI